MSKQQFLAENQLEGEIYAGLILGKNGVPDYHLFLRPEKPEKTLSWADAMAWAKSIGYELPTRRDARLLTINCYDSFDVDKWYWTSTHDAHDDGYAWMQVFDNCTQYTTRQSDTGSARAVRRVYLEKT